MYQIIESKQCETLNVIFDQRISFEKGTYVNKLFQESQLPNNKPLENS